MLVHDTFIKPSPGCYCWTIPLGIYKTNIIMTTLLDSKAFFYIVILCINVQYLSTHASSEYDTYKAIKKAFLTEENLYHIQNLIFPARWLQDSYVEIEISYDVLNISIDRKDGAFYYNKNDKRYWRSCYEKTPCTDVIAISTTKNNAQSLLYYVGKYIWIIKSVDITFFNILDLFNDNIIVPDYLATDRLEMYFVIDYLQYNPTRDHFVKALESLFCWVSFVTSCM